MLKQQAKKTEYSTKNKDKEVYFYYKQQTLECKFMPTKHVLPWHNILLKWKFFAASSRY